MTAGSREIKLSVSQRMRADLRSGHLLTLLEDVHGSLKLDVLAERYMNGVTLLLSAGAYALYIFDPVTRRPTRLAERGGVEPFITRYEQIAFAYDPLLAHVDETLEPVHDGLLFSSAEWQRHTLRQALATQRLMRMLVAPLVVDGERIGSVFFTRPPGAPAFDDGDLAIAGVLGRHLGVAVRNVLLLLEAGERARAAESTLEVMGSALVLSDHDGTLQYTNRAAQTLLQLPSVSSEAFETGLRDNLEALTAGEREAATRIPIGRSGGRQLVLRSRRLAEIDDRVATFMHYQTADQERSRFAHLRGLLSGRELEVLELLAEGLTNKGIAERLCLSTNTVQYYMKRLFALMEARSRAELLSRSLGL